MSGIIFKRIGGMMAKQIYPAVLLQIQKHDDNTIRRLLISTQAKLYSEHFLPVSDPKELYDIQWISLVRGINEALLQRQRTIHIQMDNKEIVNSILNNEIPDTSINTKYHNLMFRDSLGKTEWTGMRAF